MLFNSLEFLIFFPVVVCLYFLLPYNWRWALLLVASYFFYMCWRVEYALLIMASTIIDYYAAIAMSRHKEKRKRKKFLILSIVVNLGILFTFKYADFFLSGTVGLLHLINPDIKPLALNILLPIGISFYTFQTMSYTIDVYRGKVQPERHLGRFALFVSFFPQLVAGPIERSSNLLPQFYKKNNFSYELMTSGLRLMLWGFFKKVVIADRIAVYITEVYGNTGSVTHISATLAMILVLFQIYCDFSGYSDIAIGAARTMGYRLSVNFNRPYAARSMTDFWGRWHISLTTWFRDYVFIPLGGSRGVSVSRSCFNIFITFLISGLWHGANWNFLLWGAFLGLMQVFEKIIDRPISFLAGKLRAARLRNIAGLIITVFLISFSTPLFIGRSLEEALGIFEGFFRFENTMDNLHDLIRHTDVILSIGFIVILIIIETINSRHGIFNLVRNKSIVRWMMYFAGVLVILLFGIFKNDNFIYFQF